MVCEIFAVCDNVIGALRSKDKINNKCCQISEQSCG